MKKSWMYRLAQYAVLEYASLSNQEKVTILRELFEKEDVALYVEKTDTEMRKKAGEAE